MMQRPNVSQIVSRPACASCKHQRKKCEENCILAPFFPAERNREFKAAHKVFGVSNIQKIIKNLSEKDRIIAVDSLVWEAFCRQKDPILGPYGEYKKLYDELKFYKTCNQSYLQPSMQVLGQDDLVYKSPTCFLGWSDINKESNFGNEINHNNGTNYNNHNNMVNYSPYSSYHIKQGDGDDIEFIVPLQSSINCYNSSHCL